MLVAKIFQLLFLAAVAVDFKLSGVDPTQYRSTRVSQAYGVISGAAREGPMRPYCGVEVEGLREGGTIPRPKYQFLRDIRPP